MAENRKERGDSLSAYFSDLASFPPLRGNDEVEVFREIEKLEGRVVSILLEVRPIPAEELLRAVLRDEEASKEMVQAVEAALSGRIHGKLLGDFVDAVRLTDSGRKWMATALSEELGSKHGQRQQRLRKAVDESSAAKGRFVASNLRLVVSVARKYHKAAMSQSLNDLIQEGNIGLMKSVEKFDPDRGFRFSTYAMWWIKHHVRRAITEREPMIRIPVHMADDIWKIRKAEINHFASTGRNLEPEDLANKSGIDIRKVKRAIASREHVFLSLDAAIGNGDTTLADILKDENSESPLDATVRSNATIEIRSALAALEPVGSRILRWRFGLDGNDPLTLKEIGDILGLSRERIRQIEDRSLRKLRRLGVVDSLVNARPAGVIRA